MNADAHRDPGSGRVAVARRFEESQAGVDRAASVGAAREAGHEVRDDLITHETLDERVVRDERSRAFGVEAVDDRVELRGRHRFGHRCRSADVGEKHRDLDDRAADLMLDEVAEAVRAPARVLVEAREAKRPKQRREWPSERRTAGDTPRVLRYSAEQRAQSL